MTKPVQARSFDAIAADYDAHRPSYPPALFDAVEELAGVELAGARVADVGAGTGLGTARLRERGARVTAVEPGDGMAEQFRRSLPDVSLVRGDGNSLPLRTGSMDLITYAQSWHWTDPARSIPEARRVLRQGGALALWWNDGDPSVEWLVDQENRMRVFFGGRSPPSRPTGPASGPNCPTGSTSAPGRSPGAAAYRSTPMSPTWPPTPTS